MSKFRPKYNWKDRPVAKVRPNGEFDAYKWEWARHWAVDARRMGKMFKELLNPLSSTEEISGESVGDAL